MTINDVIIQWDQGRYDEIVGKLSPWLFKQVGYKKDQVHFLPLSGFSGVNVKDSDVKKHPFYTGPSLINYLDNLPAVDRNTSGPVRFCVSEAPLKFQNNPMHYLQTYRQLRSLKNIKIWAI